MITDEQAEDIKIQLLEQVKQLPEENQKQIKEKILSMTNKDLEEFLSKNQAISQEPQNSVQQCVFCLIVEGKINSHKIVEDKDSIAILEINPISKGHTLVIPRKHTETTKIPRSSFGLAKKIAERIRSKLSPVEIKITTSTLMGHALIEIIPFYKNTDPTKRKKADEKELIETLQLLYFVKKEKKPKQIKKEQQEAQREEPKLPRVKSRIP